MIKFIFIFLLCSFSEQQITKEFIIPKLDQNLLGLWDASLNKNEQSSQVFHMAALEDWGSAKSFFKGWHYSAIDLESFATDVDDRFIEIEIQLDQKRFTEANELTYHLIYKFRMLRDCLLVDHYPLDAIIDLNESLIKIEETITDQMFDLKDWFEFEDQVCDFTEYLDYYNSYSNEEIQIYFPSIDLKKHKETLNDIKLCFETFEESLESGYRPDFILPCHELTSKVRELILLYQSDENI